MNGRRVKVGIDEIAAAQALVAIKGEENVSPRVAALARVRPGHPVHVDGDQITEGDEIEATG